MSIEEELINRAKINPEFLSVSGSRLYGTDVLESDWDLRGCFFPPIEYILDIKKTECVELEGDYKVYTIRKFLELLLEGEPQNIEIIFSPKDKIKVFTPIAERIFSLKPYFLSNKISSRIMGFSNGEWRKAMAIKIIPEKRTKTETEMLGDLWNVFQGMTKQQKDVIIETLYSNREKEVVTSIAGLGKKRKEQVAECGYCKKSAAHSIRLVQQAKEIMETGTITFPRPNANLLKDIRLGKLNIKEVEEIYLDSRSEAEKARTKSILLDKPNYDKVWKEYFEMVIEYIKSDVRFN